MSDVTRLLDAVDRGDSGALCKNHRTPLGLRQGLALQMHSGKRVSSGRLTPATDTSQDIELSLFDMTADPFETTDLSEQRPEVAARLKAHAERHQHTSY